MEEDEEGTWVELTFEDQESCPLIGNLSRSGMAWRVVSGTRVLAAQRNGREGMTSIILNPVLLTPKSLYCCSYLVLCLECAFSFLS